MGKNIIKLSEVTPEKFRELLKDHTLEQMFSSIFSSKEDLIKVYPDVEKWIKGKVMPEFEKKDGTREIFLAFSTNSDNIKLLGFTILKKTEKEKKICTIRVNKNFRKKGIGSSLFQEAINFLGEKEDIIITISEKYINNFDKILKNYKFVNTKIIKDMYVKDLKEYIFLRKGE